MKYLDLTLNAIVASRAEAASNLSIPGDAVLIVRGQPRWLFLKCPCGCGEEIPINLDQRAGKAWRIYGSKEVGLTIFPSVWRDTGCQSHFIVWRSRILLFGRWDDGDELSSQWPRQDALVHRLRTAWPGHGWAQYVDIADMLNEIPWDVLGACRQLTKSGFLIEGEGDLHSHFKVR